MVECLTLVDREINITELTAVVESIVHSVDDYPEYIRTNLIPRMHKRRGRKEPLTATEVIKKLFNSPPNKPGEIYELNVEIQEHGSRLTASMAAEVADIIYYTFQENCPMHLADPTPAMEFFGISMEQAMVFCIAKYETRILVGNNTNHKEIENSVLDSFLPTS